MNRFFDLRSDPDERTNVLHDAKYRTDIERLERLLLGPHGLPLIPVSDFSRTALANRRKVSHISNDGQRVFPRGALEDGRTMHAFLQELLATGPVVTDGAWGTQLQAHGLAQGASPDAWNLTHPDRVDEVPRAYVDAGSQIVLTNTFQANRVALSGHGLAEQTAGDQPGGSRDLAPGGGRAGERVRLDRPQRQAAVHGAVGEEDLAQAFAEQAEALAAAGADALVIETMSDLAEAKLAVAAAKRTGLPVVACMVFDSGKDKDRTMMGTPVEQAAETLAAAGADVIGANCGQGPAGYVAICRRLRAATDRPVWIKPNAGLPQIQDGQTVYAHDA